MPRGRKSQSSQNASQARLEDDEDEMEITQPTQSGRAAPLGPEEESRLASLVARYILAAHGRGGPVKRADLRQLLPDGAPRHALAQVLAAATRLLEHVFGLTVHEVSNKRNLLVVNLLEAPDHVQLQEEEQQRRGLLMIVLALIFMNAEPVTEDLLWPFLKKLGIECDKTHECFGNVRKLITQDYVQAHYLRLEKIERPNGDIHQFHWGERAHHEVKKLQILQFVCKMWGDNTTPEKWTEQYQRAMAETGGE